MVWNGKQLNRMVVVGSAQQGNKADPNPTPIPLVPQDSSETLQFRDDVAISLTSEGHFYVSVGRSPYVKKDTLTTISAHVMAAHYTGTVLSLGTDVGTVYMYTMAKTSDLLSLRLERWTWRTREGGRNAVMAVEAMVAWPTLGVNVLIQKRNGLYALHLAHKTLLERQRELDNA